MPTTTPTTTGATTPWEPPDNVRAVLDRAREQREGHLSLTMYGHDGKETQRVKDDLDEVGDPLVWLRTEVACVTWWHGELFTHLRLRLWAPGGSKAVAGAKFRLPTRAEIPDPERRSVARTAPSAPSSPGPSRLPAAPLPRGARPATTRTTTATTGVVARPAPRALTVLDLPLPPLDDQRVARLERERDELRRRLIASARRNGELERALSAVTAERDEALADVERLARKVNDYFDFVGAE
jgi:hypothetical protein